MPDTPPEPIPMLDLKGEVEELWDEINTAIQRVLRSGQFILGPEVEAFEEEVAEFLGVKHAIGVNSGTDALIIGLRVLGIGPGDEVITTPFTFFATTEAILHVGATPVFVDIREDSFNIDPDLIEAAVTERTRAILPVHLFGNPAAMTKIMAVARTYDLKVVEDAAQSFGAVYYGDSEGDADVPDPALVGRMTGAIGDVGAFSLYPSKNLGAYGDGGLVTTDSDELAGMARSLRVHGSLHRDRYAHVAVGYNSRLDALQAAILRVKLRHVRVSNRGRRDIAATYLALLTEQGPAFVRSLPALTRGHVFHQFSLRVEPTMRDALRARLREEGIASVIYYPKPLNEQRVDVKSNRPTPMSGQVTREVLSLPMHRGSPPAVAAVMTSLDGY